MNIEIYKDIPEYEGMYQASNTGNIKSLKRKGVPCDKILIQTFGGGNYLKVSLSKNNKSKNYRVHQLVAMAFLGHIPDGTNKIVVDHVNFIKNDNKLSNLRLITNRENSSRNNSNTTSKYVGVYFDKTTRKWKSSIYLKGKQVYLGSFKYEKDASKAYKDELKKV